MPRLAYVLLAALIFPALSNAAYATESAPAAKTHAAKAKAKAKHASAKGKSVKKSTASHATSSKAAKTPVAAAAAAAATSNSVEAAPVSATNSEWCSAIGKRLGSVPPPVCQKLGLQAATVVSGNGHALMSRDIAPLSHKVAQADNKPSARARRILLIGGIHGDELTSASIVFRWLQWLDDANSEARQYHWRVIPVANPDGLLANPPQRVNSHGVDLNRNFPTPDWASDAQAYWAKKTGRDPRRFPGQSAMSESETRWLRDQIESFQPDVVVSVHAPFGILDYDGPAHQPRRFGHLDLNRLGIYPGSLGNYGGIYKNMPVITIELPSATSMPPATEQREIWEDMLTWLRRNIASKTVS